MVIVLYGKDLNRAPDVRAIRGRGRWSQRVREEKG
jgi:hypothetical protein